MAHKRLALFLALLFSITSTAYTATPTEMAFQGLLSDSAGAPLSGSHQLTFTIYDAASNGNAVWTDTQTLGVVQGAFATVLGGEANPLDATIFSGSALWLGVKVDDGTELSPRSRIGAVSHAAHASVADDATGDLHPRSVSIDGNTIIDENGKWVGDIAGLQGLKGDTGEKGEAGATGTDGIHCWDLNENGACDLPSEDKNGDTHCSVDDCFSSAYTDLLNDGRLDYNADSDLVTKGQLTSALTKYAPITSVAPVALVPRTNTITTVDSTGYLPRLRSARTACRSFLTLIVPA